MSSVGQVVGWVAFIALAVFFFIMLQKRPAGAPRLPPPSPWPHLARLAPLIGLGMLGWLGIWAGVKWLRRWSVQRMWRNSPSLHQPQTIDITDDGIRLSGETVSTEWRWPSFLGLNETTNLLLLKRSDGTHLIIPKRAAPPGQLDALRLLLVEHFHERGAFPVLPPKQT